MKRLWPFTYCVRSGRDSLGTVVITPIKSLYRIKSRLAGVLSLTQRKQLTLEMLTDLLAVTCSSTSISAVLVVGADKEILRFAKNQGAEVLEEKRSSGVNDAVSRATVLCERRGVESTLVLPADIPLVTHLDIAVLCNIASLSKNIVMCPSLRLDGTNALYRSPPSAITTYFDQNSFSNHYAEARRSNMSSSLFLSRNLMLDIDSPWDLKRLLSYDNRTYSSRYLREVTNQG